MQVSVKVVKRGGKNWLRGQGANKPNITTEWMLRVFFLIMSSEGLTARSGNLPHSNQDFTVAG